MIATSSVFPIVSRSGVSAMVQEALPHFGGSSSIILVTGLASCSPEAANFEYADKVECHAFDTMYNLVSTNGPLDMFEPYENRLTTDQLSKIGKGNPKFEGDVARRYVELMGQVQRFWVTSSKPNIDEWNALIKKCSALRAAEVR